MLDQVKFMETLRSVAEIARVSTTPLSKEEINGYFDQMELTEEQQELVYQYLLNPQPEEPMEEPEALEQLGEEQENFEQSKEDSIYLKMYMEEISEIPGLSMPEEREAYMKLVDGDASVTQRISDHWLTKVVSIAKTYNKHNVYIEDLIQEGNIGLLMGIQNLLGSQKIIDVEEYLKESVQKAMEDFIDEMHIEDDWESTVLAKTTLIHEAQKVLAEELGRTPTRKELSNFTKISEEEIQDIFHLSLEDNQTQEEKEETLDDSSNALEESKDLNN